MIQPIEWLNGEKNIFIILKNKITQIKDSNKIPGGYSYQVCNFLMSGSRFIMQTNIFLLVDITDDNKAKQRSRPSLVVTYGPNLSCLLTHHISWLDANLTPTRCLLSLWISSNMKLYMWHNILSYWMWYFSARHEICEYADIKIQDITKTR